MEISFHYHDIFLGVMSLVKDKIVYNSNIEGEEEFKKESSLYPYYELQSSVNKTISELPKLLLDFIDMAKLPFYAELIGLKDTDNDFMVLYKLSTINLENFGFYIKAKV